MTSGENPSRTRLLPLSLAVILLVGTVILAIKLPTVPAAQPESAPVGEFSAARAMRHVQIIAQNPHPLGSPAHDQVRDYIVKTLQELGLAPQIQKATVAPAERNLVANVENVLVRLPGVKASSPAVLLATHYDSAPVSFGAADDGAGVAAFLETIRALKSGPPLDRDVIVLIDDGEEEGLLGAVAFVEQHPWAKDVGVVLNFEARGTSGPSLMFETSPGNSELIRHFLSAAPHPAANSLAYEIYRLMPNDTDLTVFKKAGYSGLNFAFIESSWNYHTPGDSVANLDMTSLQHHGEYALSLSRHFANNLISKQNSNAIYFNTFGSWNVSYSDRLLIPIHVLLILGAATILVIGVRKSRINFSKVCISLGLILLVCGVCAGVAFAFHWLLLRAHLLLSIGSQGAFRASGGYALALIGVVLLTLTALYRKVRTRLGWVELTTASLFLWVIVALITAMYIPGASYLFTWPATFGLVTLGLLIRRPSLDHSSYANSLVVAASALPGAILFAPTLSILHIAMGLEWFMAAAIGLIICLLFCAAIPFFEAIEVFNPRAGLILTGVVIASGLIFGAKVARFDFPKTRFANMQYVSDLDTGKAWWYCLSSQRNEWTDTFTPKPEVGHPYLKQYETSPVFLKQAAPIVSLAEPRLEILADQKIKDKRILKISVRCDGGSGLVHISNETAQVERLTINNQPLRRPKTNAQKGFFVYLINPGSDGFQIEIEQNEASVQLDLTLTAFYPGIPKLDEPLTHQRPSDILPFDTGDISRVRRSFKI